MCAGIDPYSGRRFRIDVGFPRVCGDRPVGGRSSAGLTSVPPCVRG